MSGDNSKSRKSPMFNFEKEVNDDREMVMLGARC
jgi:hypothetical protein